MQQKRINLYNKAFSKWGDRAQHDMAVEECAEFVMAMKKLYRAKTEEDKAKRIENIREEVADVMIMMEQMAVLFGLDQVKENKKMKLERLEKRLNIIK